MRGIAHGRLWNVAVTFPLSGGIAIRAGIALDEVSSALTDFVVLAAAGTVVCRSTAVRSAVGATSLLYSEVEIACGGRSDRWDMQQDGVAENGRLLGRRCWLEGAPYKADRDYTSSTGSRGREIGSSGSFGYDS